MTPDPDTNTWIGTIAAAIGLGGSGGIGRILWKQSQHEQRHVSAEARVKANEESIKALRDSCARTETTLSGLGDDVEEIKAGVKTIVNSIAGKIVV